MKTPAEKQNDYQNCLKNVSAIFSQAHHDIPNVFHNSLPSAGAVARILLITGLRTGATAVVVGSISASAAAPLVVSTAAVAYAGTWTGNVASNTLSNAVQCAPGTTDTIDLRNSPKVRGAVLVASFHTHPGFLSQNMLPIPNQDDIDLANLQGVPGLIIAEGMVIYPYGPPRRGALPNLAANPNDPRITGFPGNSADTVLDCLGK